MNRRHPNLYYGSKQLHFIGVNTVGGNYLPSDYDTKNYSGRVGLFKKYFLVLHCYQQELLH